MRQFFKCSFHVWIHIGLATLAHSQATEPTKAMEFVKGVNWDAEAAPNMLLVGFDPGAKSSAKAAAHTAVGAKRLTSFTLVPVDVVEVPVGLTLRGAAEAYANLAGVTFVEPNYIVHLGATAPNDPNYTKCWGLSKITCPPAWEVTTGSQSVVVGVIDTGIDYNHPDLASNMWINGSGQHGIRCTNGDGSITSYDPMDDDGHGTHVAGTIGAAGNNGVGVTGVNWSVRIMALKFTSGQSTGMVADAIRCLQFAVANGAHIINSSWGYSGSASQSLKSAIESSGRLFVASAGNDGVNTDTNPHYPSGFDSANVVSVASSDSNDNRSEFSNYGVSTVDLAAPGSGIYSTYPGGALRSLSGTSMAAPHVSGVAALLLAQNPGRSYAELKELIMNGVRHLPQWNGLCVTGGRLDAYASLSGTILMDDAYEPNNSMGATAFDLAAQSNVWLSNFLGQGVQLDWDYFKITTTSGFPALVVDCRFAHASGNIDVWLYSSGLSLLASSKSADDDELIVLSNPGAKNYYIVVGGANKGNTYDLVWYTPPTVSFAATQTSASEGGGPAQIMAQLSKAPGPGKSVAVDYVVSGGTAIPAQDFSPSTGTIVFQGTETQKSFSLNIIDEFLVEPQESVALSLTNPLFCLLATSNTQTTLLIDDNDTFTSGAKAFAAYKNPWYTDPAAAPINSTAFYGGSVGGATDGTFTLARSAYGMMAGGWVDLNLLSVLSSGPAVTVTRAPSQDDPATTTPIAFRVVFEEAVTGFDSYDIDDVDVDFSQGTLGVNSYSVSGGPSDYTVTVNGINGTEGTVVVSIPPAVCTNAQNDLNRPSDDLDSLVVFDTTPPQPGTVVSNSGPYVFDNSQIGFSWSGFVDYLTGIMDYEVALGSQGDSELYSAFASVGPVQLHTFNGPFPAGVYRCTVRATNGVGLTTTSFADVTISGNTPTAGIVVSDAGPWTNQDNQLAFSWSGFTSPNGIAKYEVALVRPGDPVSFLPVALATNHVFSGPWPENTYTCIVRATSGSGEYATASANVSVDTTAPVAQIDAVTSSPTASDTIQFNVTFSESVATNFGPDDVVMAGTLTSDGPVTISGTDSAFSIQMSLAAADIDGTAGVTVVGSGITDLAGNPCTDATSPLVDVLNWRGFITQPQETRSYTGPSITFSVVADCDAQNLVYQWKSNRGEETLDIGSNSPNFTIDVLYPTDSGTYWCEVLYDGQIYVSEQAELTVRDHLSNVEGVSSYSIQEGESHTISAPVSGGFEPVSYQWRKDGVDLPGEINESLTIDAIEQADEGTYSVFVSDDLTDELESDGIDLNVLWASAAFVADKTSGSTPLAVQFTDQSTAAFPLTSWQWDFGDSQSGEPNTSTEQHPVHVYAQPGLYTVSLTVTDSMGSSAQATKTDFINVVDPPKWRLFVPFFGDKKTTLLNPGDPSLRTGVATFLGVQNLSDSSANLGITYRYRTTGTTWESSVASYTLPPYASISWRPSADDPAEGAGRSIGNSPGENGNVVIESNRPIAGRVIAFEFDPNPADGVDANSVAAFTMPNKGSGTVTAPFFSDFGSLRKPLDGGTPWGITTFIGVQDVLSGAGKSSKIASSLAVTYRNTQGVDITGALLPEFTWDPYPLADSLSVSWRPALDDPGEGGSTGQRVRNSAGQNGAAIITTGTDLTGRLLSYDLSEGEAGAYTLPTAGSNQLIVPMFSDFGTSIKPDPGEQRTGIATFIGIQNLSTNALTLNVDYRDPQGVSRNAGSTGFNLPANATISWRPAVTDTAEGAGSTVPGSTVSVANAVINSNGPIAGRVIVYDFDRFPAYSKKAIAAYTIPSAESNVLAVPFFSDRPDTFLNLEGPAPSSGVATALYVINPNDTAVTLSITYRDSQGVNRTRNELSDVSLPAHGGVWWRPHAYDPAELPGGGALVDGSNTANGGALITATGPIAGYVLVYDFDKRGLAAYTMPSGQPEPALK